MKSSHSNFKCLILMWIGVLQISPLYAADIYKNVDASGRITYSDRPEGSSSEKVKGVSATTINNNAQRKSTSSANTIPIPSEAADSSATVVVGATPIESPQNTTSSTAKSTLNATSKATSGSNSGGGSLGGAAGSGAGGTSSGTAVATGATRAKAAITTTPNTTTPNTTTPNTTTPNTTTEPVVPIRYKKWNPGHYVLVYPQGSESNEQHQRYLNVVFSEIVNNPGFKGIQKQYYWNKLEPSKGYYDFSEIKRDLAELKKINKRLIVSLEERSFITQTKHVPSYLLTSEYEGGVYPINNNNGFNATYYNENVQDRLIKLVQEMGKQLDEYPNLEAINFEETAHSMSSSFWSRDLSRRYYAGVVKLALAAEKAFPTTVVIQYINYADSYLESIFETMLNAGVGVGGPDVYENNPGLAISSYSYFPRVAGLLPIGMAVQHHNYQSSIGGSAPISPPSIESIHKFAKDRLHASYMFWLRREGSNNVGNYYKNVIDYFKNIDWNADPAGGLNTQCPVMFNECLTN